MDGPLTLASTLAETLNISGGGEKPRAAVVRHTTSRDEVCPRRRMPGSTEQGFNLRSL